MMDLGSGATGGIALLLLGILSLPSLIVSTVGCAAAFIPRRMKGERIKSALQKTLVALLLLSISWGLLLNRFYGGAYLGRSIILAIVLTLPGWLLWIGAVIIALLIFAPPPPEKLSPPEKIEGE